MINKQSIYYWFFFPLLALLSAGSLTSCIYDSVVEEDTSGKSTLSIMVRGVTTNPEQDGYDEYIETLRIIGFDASGLVCNEFYSQTEIDEWDVKGESPNTYYNITQELQNFSGGNCRFYFIANEEGYNISSNNATTLSTFLNNESLTEDGLKACIIASTPDDQDWSEKPILMIANPSAQYIKPGNDIKIADVELVRCIAKVQLQIVDETGSARIAGTPALSGSYPDSYSLLDVGTYTSWTGEEGNYSVNLTMTREGSTYTSQEIYFPERLFAQGENIEVNALKFSFTLNDQPYTAAVADVTGTDFNIRRNTHYTVIATLKKKETVTFNVMVNAWGEKTMDVPAFE